MQDPVLKAPLSAPAGGTVQVQISDSKVTEVFVSGPSSPPPLRYPCLLYTSPSPRD